MVDVKTGDWVYVVRGGHCWGKGFSEAQALAAWRAAGGTGRKRGKDFEVTRIELPCSVFVDGMGSARYVPVPEPGQDKVRAFRTVEPDGSGA